MEKSIEKLWENTYNITQFGHLPDLPDDGPVALIDGDSLIYYEMGKGTLEEAIKSLDDRIIDILARCNTARFAGFLTIGKCFRYAVAKQMPYKHNRKGGSKPIIFYALKEYIQQTWKFKYVKGLEADDLVCAYKTGNSILCSPDKDVIYQSKGKHYNYGKAKWITVNNLEANSFLWQQMLMGDPGDGVPGIPKIGPKTAIKILEDIKLIDMPTVVLKKYIEKFGLLKGITIFEETFNLLYILQSAEDVLQSTGIKLEKLEIFNVNNLNNFDDDKS